MSNDRFHHTVASEIGLGYLTPDEKAIAATAREEAIESYQRMGPTLPTARRGWVYQAAWLLAQKHCSTNPQERPQ